MFWSVSFRTPTPSTTRFAGRESGRFVSGGRTVAQLPKMVKGRLQGLAVRPRIGGALWGVLEQPHLSPTRELRSWLRPALVGACWKKLGGIDDGIVSTNHLKMLHRRDFLAKWVLLFHCGLQRGG